MDRQRTISHVRYTRRQAESAGSQAENNLTGQICILLDRQRQQTARQRNWSSTQICNFCHKRLTKYKIFRKRVEILKAVEKLGKVQNANCQDQDICEKKPKLLQEKSAETINPRGLQVLPGK